MSRASRLDSRPRVVVLEHHPRAPLGALGPPLETGAELLVVAGYDEAPGAAATVDDLISSGSYDGVVALGGSMAVYERDVVPHLNDSLRLLEDALRRGVPILGLCLGSQMLSEVLGSPVFSGAERGIPAEVGFVPLRLTEAGRADPVMQVFAGPEPVLFWHQDTHDLPAGAEHLASTGLYPMAAFRVGSRVYGFQYHLEATPELLEVWVAESPLLGASGVDGDALLSQCQAYEATIHERAERLASLFLGWMREGAVDA